MADGTTKPVVNGTALALLALAALWLGKALLASACARWLLGPWLLGGDALGVGRVAFAASLASDLVLTTSLVALLRWARRRGFWLAFSTGAPAPPAADTDGSGDPAGR